jgi:phosphoglycerol transferase MdoB-like AlkP superfamily enzyme
MELITSSNLSLSEIFTSLVFGVRLDLIVVFYLLIPLFIILSTINHKWLTFIILIFTSISLILISGIDAAYFRYAKERVGFDFWQLLQNENNISWRTYVQGQGWLLFAVLISIILFFISLYKTIPKRPSRLQLVINMVCIGLIFIIARGGIRSRPLRSADAPQTVNPSLVSLSLNPILLLFEAAVSRETNPHFQNLGPNSLTEYDFSKDSFERLNIVVVLLESFGKEYTALNHNYGPNYTPYLNELITKSVVCTDAYANGLKSMDVIPAIFCEIPKLSSRAYITSPNSLKPKSSLFNLLKPYGYSSSFFHGADNNTMGFQSFMKSQGLDHYYGIKDYPNRKADFDGNWGIYDMPYLNHVAHKLNEEQEPFVAGVFTLSSHHPYTIPETYKDSFPVGNLKIHQSIGYSDYALFLFFKECEKMEWFKNTIFVITADHSSENALHAYRTSSGKYEVPLLFYAPGKLKPGKISKTTSHSDVLASLLDLINYPKSLPLFGESVFNDKSRGIVCHYDNNILHITSNGWNMGVNDGSTRFLYNKKSDPNCLNNVMNANPDTVANLRNILDSYCSQYLGLTQ